jgi:hypothetical protein
MQPAREVGNDGCSASLQGEEAGFAVTKLGAEAGGWVGGAHGGRTTHGNGKTLARDHSWKRHTAEFAADRGDTRGRGGACMAS